MTEPTTTRTLDALFERWSSGDREALDQLLTVFYQDIHAIAVRQLRGERHLTIRPTALVHEAYLRLAGIRDIRWEGRLHFLSMAARVTRRALIDEARRRRAQKRDGGAAVTLTDENLGPTETGYDALDVDRLLNELEQYDAQAAEIVTLRVFGGLSIEESADALGISVATVNRRWLAGKTWLTRELSRRE
jgi:RNA polymerase sigma factor (TIGR02999 family)